MALFLGRGTGCPGSKIAFDKAVAGLTKGQALEKNNPKQRCLGGSSWASTHPPPGCACQPQLAGGGQLALLGLAHPSMCGSPCDTEREHIFLSGFLAGDSQHSYSAVLSPGATPGDEPPDIPEVLGADFLAGDGNCCVAPSRSEPGMTKGILGMCALPPAAEGAVECWLA